MGVTIFCAILELDKRARETDVLSGIPMNASVVPSTKQARVAALTNIFATVPSSGAEGGERRV